MDRRHIWWGAAVAVLAVIAAVWFATRPQVPPAAVAAAAPQRMRNDQQIASDKEEDKVPAIEDFGALPPDTGVVVGKVIYDGVPPKLVPLTGAGAAAIPDESMVVSSYAKNGVANVAIYMQKPPATYTDLPPAGPVVLDIVGTRFVPHMMTVRVGQIVLCKNRDPASHNVHTVPLSSREHNVLVSAGDRTGIKIAYDKRERLPVTVKDDRHTWMKAYHIVTDHPFAAVTDARGNFEIVGLPEGSHEFTVWHERADYLDRKLNVRVKAGQVTVLPLKYSAAQFERR